MEENPEEKFTEFIASKTKENPAFIHIDILGLAKIAKTNSERLNKFCSLLNKISDKKGNICIPAFSLSYTKNEVYNIGVTPSTGIGAVCEHTRKNFPGRRTVDALFSYVITGEKISRKHFETDDYESFGKGSVIEEVFRMNGYVCSIGGVFKNSTEIHYIEKLLEVKYRQDKTFSGKIIDLEGKSHDQIITYFCKNFDYNYWYDFKNLENDLRRDGLMETFKAEDYPLFISGIKFRTLYDYIEQKIKKDSSYFIKDLKDGRI